MISGLNVTWEYVWSYKIDYSVFDLKNLPTITAISKLIIDGSNTYVWLVNYVEINNTICIIEVFKFSDISSNKLDCDLQVQIII